MVSIHRRLSEDLYLNFAGMNNDGKKAVIQAYVFPLVSWIWVGAVMQFFGTLICLIPSKVKYQFAKTSVVGMVEKTAKEKPVAKRQ
ncbi:MAG: cytochrome c-type biogenesis CcmF C-terminal domain-containing protein [Bryobacteraceae bacterium]